MKQTELRNPEVDGNTGGLLYLSVRRIQETGNYMNYQESPLNDGYFSSAQKGYNFRYYEGRDNPLNE